MILSINKLLNLIKCLILIKTTITNCDSQEVIHLGNIHKNIQDKISDAIYDIFYKNSETTDDLYIIIQNHDKNSSKKFYKLISSLINLYFSIRNCNFISLCNFKKEHTGLNTHINYLEFVEFLNNLYRKQNIETNDKIKIKNHVILSDKIEKEKNSISLIHNKKFLPFQTIDELYLNIKENDFEIITYNLTILVLEGDRLNFFGFSEKLNLKFFKNFEINTNIINLKILCNDTTLFFSKYSFLQNKEKSILNKTTKENRVNYSYSKKSDYFLYFEKHFLYELRIIRLNSLELSYLKNMRQNKFKNKLICYSINFLFAYKFIFEFHIFTKISLENAFEKDKILLKETVYIVNCNNQFFQELVRFSYYIKMNIIPKEGNSSTVKDLKNIEFNKKCEQKFFNTKFFNKSKTVSDDDYLSILNLIPYKNDKNLDTDTKGIFYINPKLNQNNTKINQCENIVKFYVCNQNYGVVNDGQKKMNNFLLRLKNVFKFYFTNTKNYRNDDFIFDTNFRIDFFEKIIGKKFLTNILIDDTEAIYKIKNYLQKIFKDAEISNVIFYDFKPTIYTIYYNFESNASLASIDKQNQIENFKFLNKKNDLTGANIYDSTNFFRFFYTIKKKLNNEDIIFNAQFCYFENYFDTFRNWAAEIDIKKLDYKILKFYFGKSIEINSEILIQKIFYEFNVNLLFGLVFNKTYRKNIIKGICYNFLILKNLIIRPLVDKDSIFVDYEFERNLETFEIAYLTWNRQVLENLEKDINTNFNSFETNFLSNKQKTNQDKKLFEEMNKKIIEIIKFKLDHSILVEKIENILFIIFLEFKKYLLSQNYNNYFCILTKSNSTEIENIKFNSQIEKFKSKIFKI
ncbi:hypothetical protein GVAV_002259 [Gurleya vavrai]